MRKEWDLYRVAYVQIVEEHRKNYFHEAGYVSYTSVSAIEITANGTLVIETGRDDIHTLAAGQWVYFNTESMENYNED